MRLPRLRLCASVALFASSACVYHPEREVVEWPVSADRDRNAALARPSDRILASELRALELNSAADAIRRLRPEFLRTAPSQQVGVRAQTPSVFIDDRLVGGIEVLANIPLGQVSQIRRLSPLAARTAFGSYCECQGGVIAVTTIGR